MDNIVRSEFVLSNCHIHRKWGVYEYTPGKVKHSPRQGQKNRGGDKGSAGVMVLTDAANALLRRLCLLW